MLFNQVELVILVDRRCRSIGTEALNSYSFSVNFHFPIHLEDCHALVGVKQWLLKDLILLSNHPAPVESVDSEVKDLVD